MIILHFIDWLIFSLLAYVFAAIIIKKNENVKVEEIKEEPSKKDDIAKEEESKVNKVGKELDSEMDESPKTGDETNVKTWLLLMGISLSMTAISGVVIINQSKRKED